MLGLKLNHISKRGPRAKLQGDLVLNEGKHVKYVDNMADHIWSWQFTSAGKVTVGWAEITFIIVDRGWLVHRRHRRTVNKVAADMWTSPTSIHIYISIYIYIYWFRISRDIWQNQFFPTEMSFWRILRRWREFCRNGNISVSVYFDITACQLGSRPLKIAVWNKSEHTFCITYPHSPFVRGIPPKLVNSLASNAKLWFVQLWFVPVCAMC